MRLELLPDDQFTLKELVGPRDRTGVHYSDIIKLIQRERDPGKFKDDEGEWQDKDNWRLEVGHTFEEMLGGALNRRHPGLVRPAPITKDGIICSPDGWVPELKRLEEWKYTQASTKRELLDFRWWWFYQIKAYAYVLEAEPPAILRVLYGSGDYSRSGDHPCPTCKQYPAGAIHPHSFRVYWYDGELEETWAELLSVGRQHGLLPRPKLTRARRKDRNSL